MSISNQYFGILSTIILNSSHGKRSGSKYHNIFYYSVHRNTTAINSYSNYPVLPNIHFVYVIQYSMDSINRFICTSGRKSKLFIGIADLNSTTVHRYLPGAVERGCKNLGF